MSIKSVYKIGGDIINAIINGNGLMFMDANGVLTTLDGLRINRGGVLKEFPDLEDNPEWKKIALDRLKEHIKQLETEEKKTYYIKDELIKFGYEPLYFQKAGFRPEKFR